MKRLGYLILIIVLFLVGCGSDKSFDNSNDSVNTNFAIVSGTSEIDGPVNNTNYSAPKYDYPVYTKDGLVYLIPLDGTDTIGPVSINQTGYFEFHKVPMNKSYVLKIKKGDLILNNYIEKLKVNSYNSGVANITTTLLTELINENLVNISGDTTLNIMNDKININLENKLNLININALRDNINTVIADPTNNFGIISQMYNVLYQVISVKKSSLKKFSDGMIFVDIDTSGTGTITTINETYFETLKQSYRTSLNGLGK